MPDYIDFFQKLLGTEHCIYDEVSLEYYSYDHTENLRFKPLLVVKPKNTDQISQIVKFCNEKNLPITTRSAGTGLMGGALAIHGGIILSMERLNKIINIDIQNFQVTVEAGVINYHLQQALEPYGL